MATPKKILVAYDGSPHSRAALGWAMLLGSRNNAELEIIKVFEPIPETHTKLDFDFSGIMAQRYAELLENDRLMLEQVQSLCEENGQIKVHADLLKGPVAATLLAYAEQKKIDLIVTGTKGHGILDEMLVGSVANSLVSLSKVPVLVVKEQQAPASLRTILVAYDGSAFAKASLELALDIGKSDDAAILAVKVAELPNYQTLFNLKESEQPLAARLKAKLAEQDEADKRALQGAKVVAWFKGTEIDTKLLPNDDFADSIIRYADATKADMIVAGSVGYTVLEGLLLGSVTRKLVSLSKRPVLVVKSDAIAKRRFEEPE